MNQAGEEVGCAEVPFQQKMRNECNDYHFFYTYKKDRCPILLDKAQEIFVSGQADKQLAEFKASEEVKRLEAMHTLKRNELLYKELIVET